jgi:hypothetical protein
MLRQVEKIEEFGVLEQLISTQKKIPLKQSIQPSKFQEFRKASHRLLGHMGGAMKPAKCLLTVEMSSAANRSLAPVYVQLLTVQQSSCAQLQGKTLRLLLSGARKL